MEHAPQPHHREGIQNELDKAHDEGHRDNKAIDEAKVELAETIARVRDAGYLDTSFEGKETHSLTVRPLSKEEALEEYRNSGGAISDALEEKIPYSIPKEATLDVIIMDFHKLIKGDEALVKMDELGVRPLTHEELIQYGIKYPSHQRTNRKNMALISLERNLDSSASILASDYIGRRLSSSPWEREWDGRYQNYFFLSVRK